MPLPTDEDGNIITSAEFGEARLVKVEYNTDHDGREIDPAKEEYPVTLHGPFKDDAEAHAWADAYEPDSTDIHDVHFITLNLVRGRVNETEEALASLRGLREAHDRYNQVTGRDAERDIELLGWLEALKQDWEDEGGLTVTVEEAFRRLADDGFNLWGDDRLQEHYYLSQRDRVEDAVKRLGLRPSEEVE